MRLLWFPDRGGRPLGGGDQQQLPLAVLQLLGRIINNQKGWLAIAKLKPLSLFISLLLVLKEVFDNFKKRNEK